MHRQEFGCCGGDHLSILPPELDATRWWPFDPGLECDVWTQFSNSIGHTLPAAAAALFVGLTTTRPAARPDRATPTNSGNFLHLGSPRGLQPGADTIAPNGILTSLLFFSNWVPLPSDSFSTDIWDPAAHFGQNWSATLV